MPGVNSSYKKEVMNIVGKYDEKLFRGEDVDYNWRVKLIGWDILYHPEIKVKHIHRPTWKGLFYQHFMYGRAHYLVKEKMARNVFSLSAQNNFCSNTFKLIASWTLIPFLDAITKSKKLKTRPNGFEIIILVIINISNRMGTTIEWWFNKND